MKAVQFRIARPTNQLEALIHFYHHGLGLPIIGRFSNHAGYDGVMLGLPATQYHLEFTQFEEPTPLPPATKDNLLVCYFDNPQAYAEANQRLQQLQHQPVAPENPYWQGKSETYEDPDGWRIVLFNGLYEA